MRKVLKEQLERKAKLDKAREEIEEPTSPC